MRHLLTLCSETPGLNRFLESSKKVTANPVSVRFTTFPGHIEKWRNIPEIPEDEFVVFSDTDDVIFQTDLPEFTYDLYLAPENTTHYNTIWRDHITAFPAFGNLMYKNVYNCGTFAMRAKTLYEYQRFLFEFEDDGYRKLGLEQLYFNMFVDQRKDLSRVIDRTIFCPLYFNKNLGAEKKDRLWQIDGKVISCVHANGLKEAKDEL